MVRLKRKVQSVKRKTGCLPRTFCAYKKCGVLHFSLYALRFSMTTLTAKNFKQMLSAKKSYLPKAVSKELKAAKMGSLLTGRSVNQAQAMKALRYLREKKMLPATQRPQQLYTAAVKKQQTQAELETKEKQGRHIKAQIGLDILGELGQEERGIDPFSKRYHSGSVLGKRIIDEIEAERRKQQSKAQPGAAGSKKPPQKRPTPLDLPPAIDIG